MSSLLLSGLPWLLSALTVVTMWFAGSRWRYTWAISIGNQALWLAWIVMSATWGFLPMNAALWVVSIRNHRRWGANTPGMNRASEQPENAMTMTDSDQPETPTEARDTGVESMPLFGVWRPIETAPKDGRSIIVMNNIALGCESGVADECWCGNTDVAEWWGGEGDRGEWICYMSQVLDPKLHFKPTHWMPMPPPPNTQGDSR